MINYVSKFRHVQAFWSNLRDLKQKARSHRRNPSISILPLPSNGFRKTMRFFLTERKEDIMEEYVSLGLLQDLLDDSHSPLQDLLDDPRSPSI